MTLRGNLQRPFQYLPRYIKGLYEPAVTLNIPLTSFRFGTCLRRPQNETVLFTTTRMEKSRQVNLLGGAKKLTDQVINKFSSYYNAAIKNTVHTSVWEMRKAIW